MTHLLTKYRAMLVELLRKLTEIAVFEKEVAYNATAVKTYSRVLATIRVLKKSK